MQDATPQILTPIMQFGFAGFCGVQLCIIVWLFMQLLKVLKENNIVIAKLTEAVKLVDEHSKAALEVAIECKDALNKKPCIAQITINK